MTFGSGKEVEYYKVISQNDYKAEQVRLALGDFKDVTYIQLRKYYLDYESNWVPSKVGITVPATLSNIYALLDGLMEICSKQEAIEIINHYKAKIDENREIS